MADDRFEELLRQLPGVEIKDNKILAGGEEVKRVLDDGKISGAGTHDRLMATNRIYQEVYKSQQEGATING